MNSCSSYRDIIYIYKICVTCHPLKNSIGRHLGTFLCDLFWHCSLADIPYHSGHVVSCVRGHTVNAMNANHAWPVQRGAIILVSSFSCVVQHAFRHNDAEPIATKSHCTSLEGSVVTDWYTESFSCAELCEYYCVTVRTLLMLLFSGWSCCPHLHYTVMHTWHSGMVDILWVETMSGAS